MSAVRLKLKEAGESLMQDTRYIIQYCKDSITRAKNAMQKCKEVILYEETWVFIDDSVHSAGGSSSYRGLAGKDEILLKC